MIGDGSYLMQNSDIYSSVLTGHKLIVVVCDNGGFAVINRLQNFKGSKSFNNLIADCRVENLVEVDFAEARRIDGRACRDRPFDRRAGDRPSPVPSRPTAPLSSSSKCRRINGRRVTPGGTWASPR